MKLKSIALLCCAVTAPVSGWCKVDCRVVCSAQQTACVEPSASVAAFGNGKGVFRVPDCDQAGRSLSGPASVWYARKSLLVTKSQPKGTALASVVSDADSGCQGFMDCLFNIKSGRVVGANPMGAALQVVTDPAAVSAGLPFDDVAVPATGLSIRLTAPFQAAVLTVIDASGNKVGTFPASDQRVLVPAALLKPSEAYSFTWEAQGGALRGSFSVAQPGTVMRARTGAASLTSVDPSPDVAKLALASAYLSVGLRWNARQLIDEFDRGE